MTPPALADVVLNSRAKVAAGNADYLDVAVVALADQRDALSVELDGFCGNRPGRPGPCLCYLEERGRKCGYCRCRELLANHPAPAKEST